MFFEPHVAVLNGYSSLCTQETQLALCGDLWDPRDQTPVIHVPCPLYYLSRPGFVFYIEKTPFGFFFLLFFEVCHFTSLLVLGTFSVLFLQSQMALTMFRKFPSTPILLNFYQELVPNLFLCFITFY